MKKQIAIAEAITVSFALCAAMSPQTTVDKEAPASTPTPVIATQATLSDPPEPTMPLMEEVNGTIADPVLEKSGE